MFREADFPYMSLSDLRSTLPFQSKGMIPLPIEESELDFVPLSVLDDEQNGKQLYGILVANALSISFEDAERIKNQIGLQNVTGDERLEKAEEAIRETTAQLIVGVRNKAMAKELVQANTSDGDKTSLLSMNVSDISKALNGALPAGGQYTNLELKSYQISGANGSSDSNTATVWSGNGVVSVGFTIDSPDFISAFHI